MMIEITEEQVDKVWEEAYESVDDFEAGGMYYALELLNIIDCEWCHGTGECGKCPRCGGHKWVHNAK